MVMIRKFAVCSLIAWSSFGLTALSACSGGGDGGGGGGSLIGRDPATSGSGENTSNPENTGGSGATACMERLDSTADACDTCVANKCCEETEAFLDTANAEDYLSCAEPCDASSCYSACDDQYPSAGAAFESFSSCLAGSCKTQCGTTCGDITATDSCSICMTGSCCDQIEACAGNASCLNLSECIANCSTETCVDTCISNNPAGATLFTNLYLCTYESCASSCDN